METADEQTVEIERNQPQQSNALFRRAHHKVDRPKQNMNQRTKPEKWQSKPKQRNQSCGLCGGEYPHKFKCPADGINNYLVITVQQN